MIHPHTYIHPNAKLATNVKIDPFTVIHQDGPDSYRVVETVQTAPGARNMGLDATTHRLYVVTGRFGPPPADSTADNPRRRPPVIPGSFMMMVVERATGPKP